MVWVWIACIVVVLLVVAAALLLNDKISKKLRSTSSDVVDELNAALKEWSKTDNELRQEATDKLKGIKAQVEILLNKGEELYKHDLTRLADLLDRVENILRERGRR